MLGEDGAAVGNIWCSFQILFFFFFHEHSFWTVSLTGALDKKITYVYSGHVAETLQVARWPTATFLISNFRRVVNVVRFLLGNSPASEFYMSTFQNTLSVPSS